MDVTVIIAAQNAEAYIGRAIRSLMDQSLPRHAFEVLVIDDASTDHTLRVLESFGDWIRIVSLPEQVGLPAACNIGIRNARTRFVVRVDADDYVHEDFLRIERLFLALNTEYDAVACDYTVVNDREEVIERKNAERDPIACGIMFRKDALVNIGLYDEEFRLHEDLELRIRFAQKHTIKRLELPLYRYRRHGGNMTNNAAESAAYLKELEAKHGEQAVRGVWKTGRAL